MGLTPPFMLKVRVTLDGAPRAGVTIFQGGIEKPIATSDANGEAVVEITPRPPGEALAVIASDPNARTRGAELNVNHVINGVDLDFKSLATQDNEAYTFRNASEIQGQREGCAHCHRNTVEDWATSAHKDAASRPTILDIYSGTARTVGADSCATFGGTMTSVQVAGSDEFEPTCKVANSVVEASSPTQPFGDCANCHAPAIDGKVGGRDLLEARQTGFHEGVTCDACHKVESVDPSQRPGVGGWLKILRPSEPWPGLEGEFLPLAFGPYFDVSTFAMGAVGRTHFVESTLCGGCHQLENPLPSDASPELRERWPEGRLPVHSTFEEWKASSLAPDIHCQSCHMPPDSEAINGITLDHAGDEDLIFDRINGWPRAPGTVRKHTFVGPRSPNSEMLALAAGLSVLNQRVEEANGTRTLTFEVRVQNKGPGHALPTGEPMRAMILLVGATCGEESLQAIGGDVVPDFGGHLDMLPRDATSLAQAKVGDRVRIVARSEDFHDYNGFGRFAAGVLPAAAKGIPQDEARPDATVTAIKGGKLQFDRVLQAEEFYFRTAGAEQSDADTPPLAGHPGFAFARVMIDAQGKPMVSHLFATDVRADNRLLPGESFTTSHHFASTCESPRVWAKLIYRPHPYALVNERNWTSSDIVMLEVQQ
jgi:hypothetical protein